ncbi:bifunctional 23S rRNA (guanine(2069)-N(7))-methyltransferase RlmK/23S rRNA (guanine(2445)-N(2))-methyltransferase RlmL [Marispirochaeta sp.]|uniref:bifunctional 23S rRNA (guanine(2069)-N(7))-methyltransferase RlmK/23S rRNA (guanine(2445)-N(2))-methyltransferase RlmL n=1 Tax=Marispirochaeta sp. TaxID=2038653 RepID=UPI0029C627CE|nr:bifunctional 23S rRNA (guanine(2069)-N(7))-methyltransferase RlmK/23S rRNA (guanine(2445)-N(2))-methyltransferase RlmL [Marispirochaeta sp.]
MHTLSVRAIPLPHCEDLLSAEISRMGITVTAASPRGVEFSTEHEPLYRLLMENRSASRLIIPVSCFTIRSAEELYEHILQIPWEEHISPDSSFRIDGNVKSSLFRHSGFPVLKIKDAIVDRLRERFGSRPDVDTENPDTILSARIYQEDVEVSIDLGGGSLHRRGYRSRGVPAPLRENLAAAILYRGGWPEIAASGGSFYDPFCGGGTLCIEAALMAGGISPGPLRPVQGGFGWRQHKRDLLEQIQKEYRLHNQAAYEGLRKASLSIHGSDLDTGVIGIAVKSARAAGLEGLVQFRECPVHHAAPEPGTPPGLIATNPPYGERLETNTQAELIYTDLGLTARRSFPGWKISFLSPDKELGLATGIKADKVHKLSNGPIPVQLVHAEIEEYTPSSGTQMFINRLKKNRKALKHYLSNSQVSCYRLYDKDMPEYAFAVDIYEQKWCHLQEYAAPAEIEARAVRRRRREAVEGLIQYLDIGSEGIFLKERRKLGASDRYGKQKPAGDSKDRLVCREGDLRFFVNFSEYLDTGLFLDSRELRLSIRSMAKGKRFLNLFAYTCSATVAAAAGGAISSLSVDASSRYLSWGQDNLRLNRFDTGTHRIHQGDVLEFLRTSAKSRDKFNLAYVDPPTYSNSKDRKRDFDVQRDHKELIDLTFKKLDSGATLIFCTNFSRFEPDAGLYNDYKIEELSSRTVPPDFSRHSRIHRSFRINLKT